MDRPSRSRSSASTPVGGQELGGGVRADRGPRSPSASAEDRGHAGRQAEWDGGDVGRRRRGRRRPPAAGPRGRRTAPSVNVERLPEVRGARRCRPARPRWPAGPARRRRRSRRRTRPATVTGAQRGTAAPSTVIAMAAPPSAMTRPVGEPQGRAAAGQLERGGRLGVADHPVGEAVRRGRPSARSAARRRASSPTRPGHVLHGGERPAGDHLDPCRRPPASPCARRAGRVDDASRRRRSEHRELHRRGVEAVARVVDLRAVGDQRRARPSRRAGRRGGRGRRCRRRCPSRPSAPTGTFMNQLMFDTRSRLPSP